MAKQEVKVPSVGESITSGVIVTWLKQSGDRVAQGDNLFELETDKAVLEIPSPAAGTLEVLVDEGTEVSIGQVVATLEPSTDAEEPPAPEPPAKAEPSPPPVQERVAEKTEAPAPEPTRPAPAEETEAKPSPTPAPPSPVASPPAGEQRRMERVPMTMIRRKTAERLALARRTAAYLTTFNEIDMEKVIEIRSQYKTSFEKEHGIKIGFMSFFVKACCQSLKEYPRVNAMIDGDDIVYNHFYDIGVAMSIEQGLIVPVIRDADKLHFADIEKAIADFAARASKKKIAPDELAGGKFTITNGGVFGSLMSTPIPAYPQSAILGMHAIKKRPVVVEDQITIRPMMYVALSYDHRLIDGREAIGFLIRIKEYIEDPDKLLLEL